MTGEELGVIRPGARGLISGSRGVVPCEVSRGNGLHGQHMRAIPAHTKSGTSGPAYLEVEVFPETRELSRYNPKTTIYQIKYTHHMFFDVPCCVRDEDCVFPKRGPKRGVFFDSCSTLLRWEWTRCTRATKVVGRDNAVPLIIYETKTRAKIWA